SGAARTVTQAFRWSVCRLSRPGPQPIRRFNLDLRGNVVIMATPERDEIAGWFAGRLPDGWFTGAPSVTIDEGQIVVVGTLTEVTLRADAPAQMKAGAEVGRISRFREATRPHRVHIAR